MQNIVTTIAEDERGQVLSALSNCTSDVIELRLDYLTDGTLDDPHAVHALVSLAADMKVIIATCRCSKQGGSYKGSEKDRKEILKEALEAGASYVDLEYTCGRDMINCFNQKNVIISHHIKGNPSLDELVSLCDEMSSYPHVMLKMVYMAKSVLDNFKIFELLDYAKSKKRKLIAFCMGGEGLLSRVMCNKYGSIYTYAYHSSKVAPGQLSYEEMVGYNVNQVNRKTRTFCLMGDPVMHSKSSSLFNSLFRKYSVNAVYIPLRIKVDELNDFMTYFIKYFDGASVTSPHKRTITKYVDFSNEIGSSIGAINTIKNVKGRLKGMNLDSKAAYESLSSNLSLKGKKIAVLGAGGAARAIIYPLVKKHGGNDVHILNRTLSRAEKLATSLGSRHASISAIDFINPDVVVNATSKGMGDGKSPIPKNFFKTEKKMTIMDMVYNPEETDMLKHAKKNGHGIIRGTDMFIRQAREQFYVWTQKKVLMDDLYEILGWTRWM